MRLANLYLRCTSPAGGPCQLLRFPAMGKAMGHKHPMATCLGIIRERGPPFKMLVLQHREVLEEEQSRS